MKVNSDKDVYRYVKNLMRECAFDNILDIYFTCPSQDKSIGSSRFCINNADELAGKMFDLSLSKRISAIAAFGGRYAYVSAFEVAVEESPDHQTNITPRMIDFFRTIMDPFSRDTLVEALKPKPPPMEDDYLNWGGRFIIAPIVERNPWEYFECEGDGYV